MRRLIILAALLVCSAITALAAERDTQDAKEVAAEQFVETLEQPLYTPFVERYMLDELKQLRRDLNDQRVELNRELVDREVAAIDRAVSYSANTVTYFFYLIAGISSLLVLIGWTSMRDIKTKVHSMASHEVEKLVEEYDARLADLERQLKQKSESIDANREEIELTQDIHSLWLRASQETAIANKIQIYDQILRLRPGDCEALTYKADAALELKEPRWAVNLCQKALAIDPDNALAFYQLACAYTALEQYEEALACLEKAVRWSENYRLEAAHDEALSGLHNHPGFLELLNASQTED